MLTIPAQKSALTHRDIVRARKTPLRWQAASLYLTCRQQLPAHSRPTLSAMRNTAVPANPCLQVLSDIHLEFKRSGKGFEFPVTAPYLCLLGDIGDPGTKVYKNFLHFQTTRFEQVFVLKGNHSCYGRTPEEADALINDVCAAYPAKLKYLSKSAVPLGNDYVILGCTLWSHVTDKQQPMVMAMLADYKHITGWSVQRNNQQPSAC